MPGIGQFGFRVGWKNLNRPSGTFFLTAKLTRHSAALGAGLISIVRAGLALLLLGSALAPKVRDLLATQPA